MKEHRRTITAIGIMCVLAATACTSKQGGADEHRNTGTIVFSARPSHDDYVPQLYAIEPDGTGLRQLTSNQLLKTAMALSPDGTRLAYAAIELDFDEPPTEPHFTSIFTIALDGSGERRLCSECTRTFYSQVPGPGVVIDYGGRADFTVPDSLTWSPDGTRLAAPASSNGLLIIDVANGSSKVIDTGEPVTSVAWSPDGATVATSHTWFLAPHSALGEMTPTEGTNWFESRTRDRPGGIFLIDIATAGVEEIVSANGLAHVHGWTPDAELIAFTRDAEGGKHAELAAYSVEERRSWPLVPGERGSADQGAAWSPDGDRIAALIEQFDEEHDPMIWIASSSGDGLESVAACGFEGAVHGQCYVPGIAWSPDGGAIAYRASIQHTPLIHTIVVQPIGSDARVLRLPGLASDFFGYCCLAWYEPPGS